MKLNPENNFLFKGGNGNARARHEIHPKLTVTMTILEQHIYEVFTLKNIEK